MALLISLLFGVLSVVILNVAHLQPYWEAILGAVAIMSAGYVLSVAVEAAQKDMARAFAVIILALLAVLPEYAVDIYLAFRGATEPHYVHYATANMTGANRLLLGLFWPIVGVIGIYLSRDRRVVKGKAIILGAPFRLEVFFLFIATLYSFKLPLFGRISVFDSLILISVFLLYVRVAASSGVHEEEFEGVVERITELEKGFRISVVLLLFAFAGLTIFLSVERFAEGLISTGKLLGINEFLLIQWIAPLASELPELVVASILAYRGKATTAIGALISSKVNQWTLLIGALPLAYSAGAGTLKAMPLDALQREEIFLTAAQSLFGVVAIADLKLNRLDLTLLFVLFWIQWLIPLPQVRMLVGVVYIVLAITLVVLDRSRLMGLIRYAKNLL